MTTAHAACTHTTYLLTCESFDALTVRADGRCEICQTPREDVAGGKLVIDHDHTRGLLGVRGLLCPSCNFLLGRVEAGAEPPGRIAVAVTAYLNAPWVPGPLHGKDARARRPMGLGVPVKQCRAELAEIVNRVAVHGQITYITSRGRRVAAVVPVPIAEAADPTASDGSSPS